METGRARRGAPSAARRSRPGRRGAGGGADELMRRLIEGVGTAPAGRILDTMAETLAATGKLRALRLYLADYGRRVLVPAPGGHGAADGEAIPVSGTAAGHAFLTEEIVEVDSADGRRLWIPVGTRGEITGSLELGWDADDPTADRIAPALGMLLGSAVHESGRQSDAFEIVRGADRLALAAAMQWATLPVPAYADERIGFAAGIEPAYEVGGDAYDFAANEESFDVAVFDAMGHGLIPTLVSDLVVSQYRLSRRRRRTLTDIAGDLDRIVAGFPAAEMFVTGHICRLDLETGVFRWVNAGHPPILLARDGRCRDVPTDPMLPLGLSGMPQPPRELRLQPGDAVAIYSDGIIEARRPGGEPFGLSRLTDQLVRSLGLEIPLRRTVTSILASVFAHSEEHLRDDATLVIFRWTGAGVETGDAPGPRRRRRRLP